MLRRCFSIGKLGHASRYLSGGTSRIRNVGVVAHIDAGKTTLTERLLFLAGETKFLGNVDDGNTVTDYLDIERERGITVNSAAVSLNWKDHRIHLIDTPGHVDFGVEVERCVRVLDGLLVVIDAAAGVQAQTLVVWRQAAKFKLPSVFFINKIDKPNAKFINSIDSIEQKLGVKALPVCVPFMENECIKGVVNLLTHEYIYFGNGRWEKIKEKSVQSDVHDEWKENLLLSLSDVDSLFSSEFLDKEGGNVANVADDLILQSLTRLSLSRLGCPVSAGSALRASSSVQPLLDLITHCLPSPEQAARRLRTVFGDEVSAFVFKILHDVRRGRLAFIRVYSGQLRNGTTLYNTNRHVKEGPVEVFGAHSDVLSPVAVAIPGDIVVLKGLSKAATGDTLLASESLGQQAHEKAFEEESESISLTKHQGTVSFHGIEESDAVFFCSIEPPSLGARNALLRALSEMVLEDPSIKMREDADNGEIILETMGELHLEIIKDRLVRGYKLDVFIGPLQIAYREVVTRSVTASGRVEETLGGRTHMAEVTLRVEPAEGKGKWKRLILSKDKEHTTPRDDWINSIADGVSAGVHNGPLMSLPVVDLDVSLLGLDVSGGRVSLAIICAAAQKAIDKCLEGSHPRLLEPVMAVEIELSPGVSVSSLLHELSTRRSSIEDVGSSIRARVPLSAVDGLSSAVRTISRGLAAIHMRVDGYAVVSEQEQANLTNKHIY